MHRQAARARRRRAALCRAPAARPGEHAAVSEQHARGDGVGGGAPGARGGGRACRSACRRGAGARRRCAAAAASSAAHRPSGALASAGVRAATACGPPRQQFQGTLMCVCEFAASAIACRTASRCLATLRGRGWAAVQVPGKLGGQGRTGCGHLLGPVAPGHAALRQRRRRSRQELARHWPRDGGRRGASPQLRRASRGVLRACWASGVIAGVCMPFGART